MRSPHAHAAVQGVDTTVALASPGVVDALTAADLPGQLCTGPVRSDRPVLAAGVVRHIGEPVAAVLATDPANATRAARAVDVRYRVLPEVQWFLGEQADPLHPEGNVVRSVRVRRGEPLPELDWSDPEAFDPDAAPAGKDAARRSPVAGAEVIVDGAYGTHGWVPFHEPFGTDGMPARPAAIEAEPTDDGVRIAAPRRWHPADRDQLAGCLNLTPRQIDLVRGPGPVDFSTDLGGAVLAAVFSRRNHRPVRLILGPPTFGQGGGPLLSLRYRHHARADGTLAAVQADIRLAAGPYAGIVEPLVAELCAIAAGPYRVPSVDISVSALRSTSPPPLLEPGLAAAAVTFAVEAQLDRLADRLRDWSQGRDAARFVAHRSAVRERNALALDDPLPTGQLPLEDSPLIPLQRALAAVPLPDRPDVGPDHQWGTGIGLGMLPFGGAEGTGAPVEAEVRLTRSAAVVRCPAAEGDEALEAAAVRVVAAALGGRVRFERSGEPADGGSAATVGPAVQAAIDALTLPARERVAAAAGLSAGLLRAVHGRLQDFDQLVDQPLVLGTDDPGSASGEHVAPGGEDLDGDGQGDAFAGFSYAAARAVLRMSSGGKAEIVQLVVAADCGRVLDPERARAAVEASVATGIRLAMPEATLGPGAVQVQLVDGQVPKGVAGVAAGAVAAALRSAADQGAGGDAEVLPIPGVSWDTLSVRLPDGVGMPQRYRDPDGAS